METLHYILQFILHIDQHLVSFIAEYGSWTYALLFLIIFCETGLVVTPFLPGDSLLFAAGTLSATSGNTLNVDLLFLLLTLASILGYSLNYQIGRLVGPNVFHSNQSKLFNREYLDRAHAFYQKFGGKTLIIARFMPIIRTFAPFVAGIGYMSYREFFLYNVISAVLWIGSLIYISFWFGNIPFVKEHFSIVALAIIFVSFLPILLETVKHYISSFKIR